MEILVKKGTGEVCYITDDKIKWVGPNSENEHIKGCFKIKNTRIGDLSLDTCEIYKDINNVPSDFIGGKYLYINNEFQLNPNWVNINLEEGGKL